MGKPLIPIDWAVVEELCQIQCTISEMASVCRVSVDTLERACVREQDMTIAEYFKQKSEGGKTSLRRSQWQKAVTEQNPTLLIWLGKQYLNQVDQLNMKDVSDPKKPQRLIIDLSGKSFEAALDAPESEQKEIPNAEDT
jgi:hypothetical protein